MVKSYNDPFEHVDFNAIIAGIGGEGVKTGLTVTERGAGQNMSVDVAAGTAWIKRVEYVEGSTVNVVITAADATHPRKDIIIYDVATTNPTVVTGTPSGEPIPPDITANDILLAIVNVAANETTIANTDISDGRVILQIHGSIHEFDGYDSVDLGVYTVAASDTVQHTNATERIRAGTSNALMKETILTCLNGTIRITFDYGSNNANWAENRIYINDVARGTIRLSNSATYTTVSEDFSVSAGDRIQIYGKEQIGAGGIAKCRNLIIKATLSQVEFVDNDA